MKYIRMNIKRFYFIFFGILTAEVDFSNGQQTGSYENCYDITGGEGICYFLVSNGEPNWTRAHEKCQNRSFSLPVIRNIEEQTAIEEYFKHLKRSNASNINAVWTSGKRKTYNYWTWINKGQILYPSVRIINSDSAKSAEETHMTISNVQHTGADNILKTVNPVHSNWYLCQYKDRQCNGQQHEVNATNGCLIPSEHGNVSWYGARNECLSKRGDLAVLTHQDLQNLKSHRFPNNNYWIGLRKADWVWITYNKRKESTEEEVKYTKWARQAMPTQEDFCISIWENDGQWKASDCNNAMLSVVCEQRAHQRQIPASKTTTGNPPNATVTMAACINGHNSVSSMTVGLVLGLGVVVPLLIVIIILIITNLNLKKKLRKMSVSRGDNTLETHQYQELQRPVTYANSSDNNAQLDNYEELRLQPSPE